jgi:hypothetical protein
LTSKSTNDKVDSSDVIFEIDKNTLTSKSTNVTVDSSSEGAKSDTNKKKRRGFAKIPEMVMPKGMDEWVNKIQKPMKELQGMMGVEDDLEEKEEEEIDKRFSMKLY